MNFMEKLSKQQLTELQSAVRTSDDIKAVRRIQAIISLENKLSADMLELLTGYKRPVAIKLRKTYLKQGLVSLQSKSRRKNFKALLTRGQREQLIKILNTHTPLDFGYNQAYWTVKILADLLLEQWGIRYRSRSSIYLLLKAAKFTFRKPEKRSERYNPQLVAAWKEQYEPIIKEVCACPDTVVLVGDEAVLTSETRTQKVWLPRDLPAFIETAAKRQTKHLYGFLDVASGAAAAFKTDTQTGETTVSVLKKLAQKYPLKKIVIFWDNASWHKSATVRAFLTTTKQFKLYNFPPYAPELNPQKHVWKEVREKRLTTS